MSKNPLFSRHIREEGPDQVFLAPIDSDAPPRHPHPRLTKLPHWPSETIAVLCTVDETPYAIPVTAPLRVSDSKILLSLDGCRGSLARLQENPQVALLILSAGDLAFTVRGRAFVVETTIAQAPEFAAVAIEAEAIDDHRLPGRPITRGAAIDWDSASTQHALKAHLDALTKIAGGAIPPLAAFGAVVDPA
jgi:hypothetical protein